MKNEKYVVGEKVYLTHLKQIAYIKRIINNELVYIEIEGDEIPFFLSDLSKEFPAEEKNDDQTQQNKTIIQLQQNSNGTNQGIFIAFDPESDKAGNISSFNIYLINDTSSALDYSYELLKRNEINFSLQKLLTPYNYVLLHSIEYDLLNEGLQVNLKVREVKNDFKGEMKQKIKAQNFFNKQSPAPLIKKETFNYQLIPEYKKEKTEPPIPKRIEIDAEDLKRMMTESVVIKDKEKGEAIVEIDLHIEELIKDCSDMSSAEMLHLQLSKFQQALERAIAQQSLKLIVIHGIGKGKLKQEIHLMLKNYRHVRSFNNNYHPRYGYGATEVILQ
ncbi:MAG: DUF2027 domain-containing protein [Chitinophagales bacterium]|nr:DUF2027 domain-containing protein [Chitinophagales bacterium]